MKLMFIGVVLVCCYLQVILATSQHHQRPYVSLNKLCTWKTLTWNNPIISNGTTFGNCEWGTCGNYIVRNNVPTAFEISRDGRVFVGVRRDFVSIYSTLNYFHINDIQDGVCPPLNSYPSIEFNQLLDPSCEHPDRVLSVDRFTIDTCQCDPKLWVIDLNGLFQNDRRPYPFAAATLKVYSLTSNTLLRSVPIPIDIDDFKGLGLTEILVEINPMNCNDAYAYILDKFHSQIIVYSWAENRLWTVSTPLFGHDAISTKFYITTPKGKLTSYFVTDDIHSGALDLRNQQLIFHARASLNEFAISLYSLKNRTINAGGPENIPIQYLGQKNVRGQTGTHQINPNTRTVWGIQEQNHAIACWNRDKPLNPNTVKLVASCSKTLPFLVDLQRTIIPGKTCSGIFVLTNNQKGIEEDGFDPEYENFGIYYIDEKLGLNAYPECLNHAPHYRHY